MSEPAQHLRLATDRPVSTVRPLGIGAAHFADEFECLAPWDWTGAMVLAQLFKLYDMEGWKEAETSVQMIARPRLDARRWLVAKQ